MLVCDRECVWQFTTENVTANMDVVVRDRVSGSSLQSVQHAGSWKVLARFREGYCWIGIAQTGGTIAYLDL